MPVKFEYINGDLLASDELVIAHGCNIRGAFAAGIAGQIGERWPHVRGAYKRQVWAGEFQIGGAYGVPTDPIDGPWNPRYVVNLGTQTDPGPHATLAAIEVAFANLTEWLIRETGQNRIAIPRIGCGIGGLKWDGDGSDDGYYEYGVEGAIQRGVGKHDITVAVYDLPVKAEVSA